MNKIIILFIFNFYVGLTFASSYEITFLMLKKNKNIIKTHEDSYTIEATTTERAFELGLAKCMRDHKDSNTPCEVLEIKKSGDSIPFIAYKMTFEVYGEHFDYYTSVSSSPEDAYTNGIIQCAHEHSKYLTSDDCKIVRILRLQIEPINVRDLSENIMP